MKETKSNTPMYENATTGEVTENHKQAVKWLNEGNKVNLYNRNSGQLVMSWEN